MYLWLDYIILHKHIMYFGYLILSFLPFFKKNKLICYSAVIPCLHSFQIFNHCYYLSKKMRCAFALCSCKSILQSPSD